jgi:hypothetical protein
MKEYDGKRARYAAYITICTGDKLPASISALIDKGADWGRFWTFTKVLRCLSLFICFNTSLPQRRETGPA